MVVQDNRVTKDIVGLKRNSEITKLSRRQQAAEIVIFIAKKHSKISKTLSSSDSRQDSADSATDSKTRQSKTASQNTVFLLTQHCHQVKLHRGIYQHEFT